MNKTVYWIVVAAAILLDIITGLPFKAEEGEMTDEQKETVRDMVRVMRERRAAKQGK